VHNARPPDDTTVLPVVRENGVASTRSACGFLEVAYTGRLAHQGRFGGLVRGLENDLFTRC
uniref:hypothetical protein n=1 Tax=Pseudoxanthomonas sp. SGT-18 TaxID=2493087 RepID=UPI0019819E92